MYHKGNELPSSVSRLCQQFVDITSTRSLLILDCERQVSKTGLQGFGTGTRHKESLRPQLRKQSCEN